MKIFLVHVGDDNFCRVLPKELDQSSPDNGRVRVMAFPPLGIQTLAPVLRRRGHQVRMFDTCHPQMQAEQISQAAARDWDKWFKCSDIDPTTLASTLVNRLRARGYAFLFLHRILRRPVRTWRLLRAFSRHMRTSDLLNLLSGPFRRRPLTRMPDLPARMADAGRVEAERQASAGRGPSQRRPRRELEALRNAAPSGGGGSCA